MPLHFTRISRLRYCAVLSALFLLSASFCAAETPRGLVSYKKAENNVVTISVDGEFFAQFRPNADSGTEGATLTKENGVDKLGGTPIIWPICSANGTLMSRGYPMDEFDDPSLQADAVLNNILANSKLDTLTAAKDHVHHRSLWFNHGDVNLTDFWGPNKGEIVCQAILSITEEAHQVTVVTQNAWIPEKDAEPLCSDIRTITFGVLPDRPEIRFIDYDIDLTATADNVKFADTKEGSFGYRIPGTMDVTANERNKAWGGHIVNSSREEDEAAWGKRASWVDYSGPAPKRLTDAELAEADAEHPESLPLTTAGVDIMNHPASYQYPSWYHVRTYGLFAVNPFGKAAFEGTDDDGAVELRKGDQLSFRYRVLLHDGVLQFEDLEKLFEEYKSVPKN